MKIFKEKLDTYKTKKDLTKELKIYREFILKKLEQEELNSAMSKARSALTLIKEHEDLFDLEKKLKEFNDLNQKVLSELNRHRDRYVQRLYRLLKESVDESNLEKLMKLLTSLKTQVDKNVDEYNLVDIQGNILRYFKFIKRLYIIFASYEVIDYFEVSENIFRFIEDLKFEDFPNLENLGQSLLQKLITRRLSELSKEFKMLSIPELSDKLAISQEELIEFIYLIVEQPNSPVKVYNSTTEQVILNYNK
jgi:hypothetical protein